MDPKLPSPKQDHARAFMLLGLGVFTVALVMARLGREPFATWFYPFAWWSAILVVDGWVHRRRGESLILDHPRHFLFLSAWSVGLWLLYEAVNFRLGNWHYLGLPESTPLRWLGYAVSFATVVPGILEAADLLDAGGLFPGLSVRTRRRWHPAWIAGLGALFLVLPLAVPLYFFPLVWGALFLLLDPWNDRLGAPSLLADLREGGVRKAALLLVAGGLCGLYWEACNSLAAARWVYTVPFVGEHKIFEMPALGYLGFPPFALSVYAASATAAALWDRARPAARAGLAVLWILLSMALMAGVDRFSVLRP